MGLAAEEVELPEAILSLGIAVGKEEIIGIVRFDMRYPRLSRLIVAPCRSGAATSAGPGDAFPAR